MIEEHPDKEHELYHHLVFNTTTGWLCKKATNHPVFPSQHNDWLQIRVDGKKKCLSYSKLVKSFLCLDYDIERVDTKMGYTANNIQPKAKLRKATISYNQETGNSLVKWCGVDGKWKQKSCSDESYLTKLTVKLKKEGYQLCVKRYVNN